MLLTLLETIGDPALAFDGEGVCRFANPAAGRLLDADPQALVGYRVGELFPGIRDLFTQPSLATPEDAFPVTFFQDPASGRSQSVGARLIVAEEPAPREVAAVLLLGPTGLKAGAGQESEGRSETWFRLLAERARDIIFYYRFLPRPGFEFVNSAATSITGFTPEEHYADPELGMKLVHPDDRHLLEKMFRQGGGDGPISLRWVRKDGTPIWTEVHGTTIADGQGAPRGIVGIARDITYRKELEQRLQQSEGRYRSLFDFMGEALFLGEMIYDGEGSARDYRAIEVNPAWESLTGIPRSRAVGRSVGEIFGPAGLDYVDIFQQALESRQVIRFTTLFTPLGRHLQVCAFSVGKRTFGALLTDVTELKRMEEALREREERFRQLAENIDEVFWLSDWEAGQVIYVSPVFEKVWGFPVENLYGNYLAWMESIVPEDRERIRRAIAQSQASGFDLQYRIRRPDGSLRWIRDRGFPVREGREEQRRLAGIAEDITARREAEEDRNYLLAKLDATLESIPDGLIVYNNRAEILQVNRAAQKIFGYSEEDLGKPFEDRISRVLFETAEGRPYALENLPPLRALRGETVLDERMVIQPPRSNQVYLSVSAAPVLSQKGERLGAVAVLTDITLQHGLEEQKELLLHTVSHDLRQPLTVIQGYADLLRMELQKLQEPGELLQHLDLIAENNQSLGRMVADLVEMARLEGGSMVLDRKPGDLDGFLRQLVRKYRFSLPMDRLRLDVPPGAVEVRADWDKLERVMVNLISNAMKYSPAGSPVEVSVHRSGDRLVILVTDYGEGIAAADLPHLFKGFYRPSGESASRDSVGLGLYIVRSLVEAHGGHIWVESQPGEGSSFIFTLPLE